MTEPTTPVREHQVQVATGRGAGTTAAGAFLGRSAAMAEPVSATKAAAASVSFFMSNPHIHDLIRCDNDRPVLDGRTAQIDRCARMIGYSRGVGCCQFDTFTDIPAALAGISRHSAAQKARPPYPKIANGPSFDPPESRT